MDLGLAGNGLSEQNEFYIASTNIGRKYFVMADEVVGTVRPPSVAVTAEDGLRRPAPRNSGATREMIRTSCVVPFRPLDAGGDIAARCPYQKRSHRSAMSLLCSLPKKRSRPEERLL